MNYNHSNASVIFSCAEEYFGEASVAGTSSESDNPKTKTCLADLISWHFSTAFYTKTKIRFNLCLTSLNISPENNASKSTYTIFLFNTSFTHASNDFRQVRTNQKFTRKVCYQKCFFSRCDAKSTFFQCCFTKLFAFQQQFEERVLNMAPYMANCFHPCFFN